MRLLSALLMVCCVWGSIPDPVKKGVPASLDVVAGPAKFEEFPTDTLHCRSLVHPKNRPPSTVYLTAEEFKENECMGTKAPSTSPDRALHYC